jgi:hypothetical protein
MPGKQNCRHLVLKTKGNTFTVYFHPMIRLRHRELAGSCARLSAKTFKISDRHVGDDHKRAVSIHGTLGSRPRAASNI